MWHLETRVIVLAACLVTGVAAAEDDLAMLNARVMELTQANDLDGAVEAAERAVEIAERRYRGDSARTSGFVRNLAFLYSQLARYAEAETLYRRALEIDESTRGPDHPATATSLGQLAGLYDIQGRYAEAGPLYRRAIAISEKTQGRDHPETALEINNLAVLEQSLGKLDEAEKLYQRALAIFEKALGPKHPGTATCLDNLAANYQAQGKGDVAEPLFRRARAIREKALGPDHPDTAISLNNLADVLLARGDDVGAEPLYRRALAIYETSFGPEHPDTAQTLMNVAKLLRSRGASTAAEPLYQRAVASYEKVFGSDNPAVASSLGDLAGAKVAMGRFSDACRHFDQARRVMRRYVARVLPALTAAEQAVFLRTRDEALLHKSLTLGALRQSTPEAASLSAGWLANGKAVAQEAASQQFILARQRGNPEAQAAVKALERVRGELARLSQVMKAPRARVAHLHAEEVRLIREIGGQLAAIDRGEPWVEIEEIRRNIPAGAVVVDIARFGAFDFAAKGREQPWGPARYAAWIIPAAGKGDVRVVDLGAAEEIDRAVAAYRDAIEAVEGGVFPRGQSAAEESLKITAGPLTRDVLQPIIEAIGSAEEIILSPDGALWLVPWQALPFADGSYCIESFPIRTVTSSRDLVPVPVAGKGSRGAAIVVADPAFDAPTPSSEEPAGDRNRSSSPSGVLVRRFLPLRSTRGEAMATKPAIAVLTGGEPMMLLGPEASETNVKRAAVRPKSFVLATHGFFMPDQSVKMVGDGGPAAPPPGNRGLGQAVTTEGMPLEDPLLRCGLALAGANLGSGTAGDDGILTGAEIVGLDLSGTDLVVLSACETGVGTVRNGEGVAGLRQAFQIAGAKSVVATLWRVPDLESSLIMEAFYANLARGQTPAEALREAQIAFIKSRREDRAAGEAAHPALWAAYGVTGR